MKGLHKEVFVTLGIKSAKSKDPVLFHPCIRLLVPLYKPYLFSVNLSAFLLIGNQH